MTNGQTMGTAASAAMLERLAACVDGPGFTAGPEVGARHHKDSCTAPGCRPLALLRPRETAEVSAIAAVCHAEGLPVTVQGGLTGLSGGALPDARGIALSLDRMAGIERIDKIAKIATVRAGTPLQVLQQAAENAGLRYPVDLNARASCQIGGTIATNAGGNRVIRYGMTRAQVLGVEAVLPDGTVLSDMLGLTKNNAGFDLKQLLIGSEGQLGIVTRAQLRLVPQPTWRRVALLNMPDHAAALVLLDSAQRRIAGDLSAFEVMWHDYWQLVTEELWPGRSPFADRTGCFALIEAEGTDPEGPDRFEHWLADEMEAGRFRDAVLSQSEADCDRFWALREAAAEISCILGPFLSFDIGLPITALGAFVADCRAAIHARLPKARVMLFGHAGDGNLHIMAATGSADPADAHWMEAEIFRLTKVFHGSVTAEHGVGRLKRDWLHVTRTPVEIAMMRDIKAAFDPRGILNPGRVLP